MFSLQNPCSGLHFENRLFTDKAPLQVRFRQTYVFMHTKVCAHLFTNKCPYDACVALHAHAHRVCVLSRAARMPAGTGCPPTRWSPAGHPSKLNQRCHIGYGASLPAPTGPRAAQPTPTQATQPRAVVGAGRTVPARRLGAPAGLSLFLKDCAAHAQPPAPPRRAGGREGGRGARPAEAPPRAAASSPRPRRPSPAGPSPARPPGAGRSGLFCCAAAAAAGLASSFVPGWSPFLSPQC